MMPFSNFVWLTDFHLAALGLLTTAMVIGSRIKQPAERLAIAWGTTLGLVFLLGVVAIPGWSLWSLARSGGADAASAAGAPLSADAEPSSPRQEKPAPPATDLLAKPDPTGTVVTYPTAGIRAVDLAHGAAGIILPLYLCGAVLAAGWLLLGWWLARRLVGRAVKADLAATQAMEGLTNHPPRLLVSDRLSGPVAIGFIRPTVLLPKRLVERSDASELRTVLAHELAHVQGGDLRLLAVLRLLLVVLWCNPLYWLLRRRVRIDQETLADAAAADQSDRHAYAQRLVGWARELAPQPRLAGAAGLWESPSQLRRRITLLLDDGFIVLRESSTRWRAMCLAGCSAVAVLGSLVTLGAAEPQGDSAPPPETAQGLTYSGIVVDKKTGEPIEGVDVLVRLKTSSVHPWPTLDESTYSTDAEGNYQFTITPAQLGDSHLYIEVEAAHPDYARKSPSGYALSMIRKNQKFGEEPFFSRIELRPAEEVFGVLLDPDGQPAAGVNVLGYSKENPRELEDYGSFTSTEADEEGRFRLNMVAGGHSVVWFRPRDFAPETHVLKNRKGDLGTIQLERGVSLSGRVVDSLGAPVAGVWVNAELLGGPAKKPIEMPVADCLERSALTDSEGRYAMRPLPEGVYRVLPEERPTDALAADRTPRPLPATFLPRTFELSADQHDLDIQAADSVIIRARTLSSSGKPTRGHGFDFAGWVTEDGDGFYSRHAEPDPLGKVEIRVPKGLKRAQLHFSTNEHGALRIRLSPDDPLVGKKKFVLGTLDRDYDQIEIIRYKAPILLVGVTDASGKRLDDILVSVVYKNPALNKNRRTRYFDAGEDSDVGFDHQQDDRWRSSQLLPDEPFELRVVAQGKELPRQQLQLEEGETRTIELALEGEVDRVPAQ